MNWFIHWSMFLCHTARLNLPIMFCLETMRSLLPHYDATSIGHWSKGFVACGEDTSYSMLTLLCKSFENIKCTHVFFPSACHCDNSLRTTPRVLHIHAIGSTLRHQHRVLANDRYTSLYKSIVSSDVSNEQ